MSPEAQHRIVLTLSCPDRPGIVGRVGQFLADRACNISESAQYGDAASGRFFMRVCFVSAQVSADALAQDFETIAREYQMVSGFAPADHRPRTIVLVSKFGHCLNDLLYRRDIGDLPIDIAAIVSNHPAMEALTLSRGLPFHHIPVSAATKEAAEAELSALMDAHQVELLVLARYMQVLSPGFCGRYPGRIINIHHSFLPGFKGAKPYHQAHDHGVKLIGATAHYVTADLDEGPIIEQEVVRVDHATPPERMVAYGRDIENIVLARAVEWHAAKRVIVNGRRTVVFR